MTIQRRGTSQTGEQLKMFMTPREIHAQYQPLDADRMGQETVREYSGSGTFHMGRHTTTGGGSAYGTNYGHDSSGNFYQRTEGGSKWMERPESDEELWSRKHAEAYGEGDDDDGYEPKMVGASSHWSGETYHPSQTTTGGGRASSWESPMRYTPGNKVTLGESIEAEGVKSPIRLGSQIGSQGKREIVGGHHRLAVATNLNQDQFVPVLHHENIGEARSPSTTQAWKYT